MMSSHTRLGRCSTSFARVPSTSSAAAVGGVSAIGARGPRLSRRGTLQEARAVAPPVEEASSIPELSDEQRTALAKSYGYRSIGKDLPEDVSLGDIVRSLPNEVFQIDEVKSWKAVALTLGAVAGSLGLIAMSPWYLLPFSIFLAGTAATGLFVIGHDCGHRSFSKNKLLEDIVGTLVFMPLIYPFEPWRIKHNYHHAHTNKLHEDTAWHPIMTEHVESWGPVSRFNAALFLGSPLKCWASIGHWAIWHFDQSLYTNKQMERVKWSWAAVAAFVAIGMPLIVANFGWAGFAKFWLGPWLGYHFWMSTFTVVHHTAPHIPFKTEENWNAAKAQLSGSVHCDYPAWVDTLTHDISWHVPHHVSTKIPWYNLRKATESLRQNWGEHMTECKFNWKVMKTVFTELHVYDEKKNYVPMDNEKENLFFAAQRKIIPDSVDF